MSDSKAIHVRVKLSPDELRQLDRVAKQRGSSRNEVLRSRAVAKKHYTPSDYSALVSRANRCVDMPRSQVERVVNFVFVELMEPDVLEATP